MLATTQATFLIIIWFRPPSVGVTSAEGSWQILVRYAVWCHALMFFGEKDGPARRWTGTGRYLFGAFASARYRLTCGTLKEPLFPCFGFRTTYADVLVNVVFLVTSVRAIVSCSLPSCVVGIVCLCDVWNAFSNYYAYLIAQGPSYLGILICGCFPANRGLACAQVNMMIVWIGSGLAKMGPWFAGVNGSFLCSSYWLSGQEWLWKCMYRSEHDLRPTVFAEALSRVAASVEWGAPLLLLCVHSSTLIYLGIALLAAMHIYIVLLCTVDLYVWNFYFAIADVYLFALCGSFGFDIKGFYHAPWPLLLNNFFQITLFICGSVFPDSVAYQAAHRYWAGNWPGAVFLLNKESASKFLTIPNFGQPAWDVVPSWLKEHGWLGDRPVKPDLTTYKSLAFFINTTLNFKYIPSLLQRALGEKPISDYYVIHSSLLFDMLFGFGMSCDANRSASVIKSIQEIAGFSEGECICLWVGGFPAIGRNCLWGKAKWQILDAKVGVTHEGDVTIEMIRAVASLPSACKWSKSLLISQ